MPLCVNIYVVVDVVGGGGTGVCGCDLQKEPNSVFHVHLNIQLDRKVMLHSRCGIA